MFLRYLPKKMLLLFFGDVALIYLAIFLSLFFRFSPLQDSALLTRAGAFILATYILAFYLLDLYDINIRFRSLKYLSRFLGAMGVASGLVTAAFFFFPTLRYGRGEFLINIGLIGIFTYSWRMAFGWWFDSALRRQKRLLIAGAGWAGRALYETLKNNPDYKVLGFVIDDNPSKWGTGDSFFVVGGSSVVKDIVRSLRVDILVIAVTHLKGPELLRNALDCKMDGVDVYDMPSFCEMVTGKVPVEHVNDFWLVSAPLSGVRKSAYTLRIKRMLDLTLSLLGLAASLPITIPTAIAIKLDSPGPVFFRQKRVGLHGEVFNMIKFRSMGIDADKSNIAAWDGKRDPRITRVGRVIRKLRIDEIPQMWNVLRSEMSFIGPRALVEGEVREFDGRVPYFSLRHSVRPGITGWAQVNYKHGATVEDALEKLQYDLFYIKNLSSLLDFHILLKTVKVVLWGKGAK